MADTASNTPAAPLTGWKGTLQKAAVAFDKSSKDRKRASSLLWDGAQVATEEWLAKSDVDVHAENLYADVLDVLGKERKGDASKIKTVALAVRNNGLVMASFPNLSKAYAEAKRLTQTLAQQKAEDDAAEQAIENIDAPSSTTTQDGAARILLSKGLDGAVVAILDALNGPSGEHNEAAQRAFLRAVATEIAARVQAHKPKPVKKAATPKGAAKKAAKKASPKATPKSGADKAKPVKKAAATKATAPAKKASPKPKPVQRVATDEGATDTTEQSDDLFEEFGVSEADEAVEAQVGSNRPDARPEAKAKGRPVRR